MDILEGLTYLLVVIVHWRITLCLIASSALAIFLVQEFSWLNGFQGVVLALCGGFIAGAFWEDKASEDRGKIKTGTRTTSTGVASLAAAFVGVVWGTASAASLESFLAGAVIFALTAWGWNWYAQHLKAWVDGQQALIYIASAGVVYTLGAWLSSGFVLLNVP